MNLKWLVAIGLILILVITPVSAAYHKTNMTRVNTSGCWDRFNMGWLYRRDCVGWAGVLVNERLGVEETVQDHE